MANRRNILRLATVTVVAFLLTAGVAVATDAASSGSSGIERQVLATTDPVNAPGQTLTLQRVEIAPRTTLAEHFHAGTQLARVVQGTLTLRVVSGLVVVTDRAGATSEVRGPATVKLRAGESVVEVPPVVHYGKNATRRPVGRGPRPGARPSPSPRA